MPKYLWQPAAAEATAVMLVAKGRDHMGVVKALLEDKNDVLEKVREFLGRPNKLTGEPDKTTDK